MKKILAIHDSPTNIIVLKSKLGNNYKVEQALNSAEAINKFTKNTDLILTDLNINNANSLELIKQFREKGFKGKVIFLTTSINDSLISEFNKIDAFYIEKSQSNDYLASEINKMLGGIQNE